MKSFSCTSFCFATILVASLTLLSSCNKDDEFTIENKAVSGDFTYVRTAFIPLTFDSTGVNPLSAQISMEGNGNVPELGDLVMETTFKFDFILGKGYDFVTTYTGSSSGDSFFSNGTSQLQPNGSFIVVDELNSGAGKFAKISGDGTTTVWLNQTLDSGTGTVEWTITF